MLFQPNLQEITQQYQYFIFDIWGVIHDGSQLYPGVLPRLEEIRALGKKICFLSNAPRRAKKASLVLHNLGIKPELYDFVLTSGETIFQFLQQSQNNPRELENLIGSQLKTSNGQNYYYYIGPKKDADLLDGLQYLPTTQPEMASFVIATGFDDDNSILAEKLPQLQAAIKHNLPMICVNPDLIVVKQNGAEMLCAGLLAAEYQKMGGRVVYFGKPHPLIYKQLFKLFAITTPQDLKQCLTIGDALETDILGANRNDIDSALIAGGILGRILNTRHGDLPNKAEVMTICQKYQCQPQFVIGKI